CSLSLPMLLRPVEGREEGLEEPLARGPTRFLEHLTKPLDGHQRRLDAAVRRLDATIHLDARRACSVDALRPGQVGNCCIHEDCEGQNSPRLVHDRLLSLTPL